jgi:CDP-6-deoxy-D-xylo-4-hexulose-3-dehydrase
MSEESIELRREILERVVDYHDEEFGERTFVRGESPVQVSGRVFDADDLVHLVDASLDFWLTAGRYAERFEKEFARTLGARHALLCNSGSSANLLAVSALTSRILGERRLSPGDEIVTVAAGFPTTVNPIVQNGLVPVFVDIELGTYNADLDQLEAAIGPRTKAVILAHTLGNPYDLDRVVEIARKHDLWMIEDNCDALDSTYKGRPTGTFGDMATVSFYPAHHITMGEGGCVLINRGKLMRPVESFRDWGRDCWCGPGKANTCGKRFGWQLGQLPESYDHKYIYSHVGYNLKATDMQAAVGIAQLKKLPEFTAARKRNWAMLREGLEPYSDYFLLPQAAPHADPSWFGFLITVRPDAPFTRADLQRYLENNQVGTRLLFAGNLARQPAYQNVRYRIAGDLARTDVAMDSTLWIGVYPGITNEMVEYVLDTFDAFIRHAGRPGVAPAASRQVEPARWPGTEPPVDGELPNPSEALDRLPLV